MQSLKTAAHAGESIVIEYDLQHPPAKVWRALTDAELVGSWLMPNDLRAEVGHRFTFKAKPVEGWNGVVECEVLIVEPHRRLSYSWRGGSRELQGYGHFIDTVVTWTLTPTPRGTLLRLDHDGFPPASFALSTMKEGWNRLVKTCFSGLLGRMQP